MKPFKMRLVRVFGYPAEFKVSQIESFEFPVVDGGILKDWWGFRRTSDLQLPRAAKAMAISYVRPANDNFLWKNPRLYPNGE